MSAGYTAPRPAVRRQRAAVLAAAGAAVLAARPARAQGAAPAAAPAATFEQAVAALPFAVGERLEYDARLGRVRVGSGYMHVVGRERVRGQEALHVSFRVEGGPRGFRVRDVLDSWIDPRTFSSLRFVQDLDEGPRERQRHWEIYPDRRTYVERGRAEQPSVEHPLDDGAFLYFVRTVPLEVGRTYTWQRYFRPDRNPVQVTVLRRERITVPAGTFDTIVLRPSIRARGIFAQNRKTELWFTSDERRILVQLRSDLPFGDLGLRLRAIRSGTGGGG